MSVALVLLAIAGVAFWILDRRILRQLETLQVDIDRNYALAAHRLGMTTEQIAVELGRPAHQVRDWLELPTAARL